MSKKIVADVVDKVYAYRSDALLVIYRGQGASPFGPAYEPVREELVGRCQTLGYRGENTGFTVGDPEWLRTAELSIFKVWEECPHYEHECVLEVTRVG